MLVPNQYFDIKIIKTNIDHYRSLGYDVNLKDIITVPAEHLTPGSHQPVQVQCDVCEKTYIKPYKRYVSQHTYGMDTCNGCKNIKYIKTCIDKYGYINVSQVPEIRKKVEQTCIDRYGVINVMQDEEIKQRQTNVMFEKYGVASPSQNENIKAQIIRTNLERYGVKVPSKNKEIQEKTKATVLKKYGTECTLQNEIIKEKARQTMMERYGTEHPQQNSAVRYKTEQTNIKRYGVPHTLQNPEIKQKVINTLMNKYQTDCVLKLPEIQKRIRRTNLEKYGYESAMKNPEVKQKIIETFYKNSTMKTSSQQIKLHEMIKQKYPEAELNYPFSNCSLDVLIDINNVKIDIEYDCDYWHQDLWADLKRDKFLQSNGFKTLRIRSRYKLPTEEQLFLAIDELVTTDRVFEEIILSDWNPEQYKINNKWEVSS